MSVAANSHGFRCLVAALLFALPGRLTAQIYSVGDVVTNFTLTDRATNQPVNLTDFAGKVVFLEWFAWWCPFCQAAAAQTGPGIGDYYADQGGNAHGVPVVHVAVNLQSGQEQQTQQFINAYGLDLVLNDFSRVVANRFQSGGQPIFAIINGVAGSPGHEQWELLFSHLGYGSLNSPIEQFRQAIDSVRPASPAPVEPPRITVHPTSRTVAPGTDVTLVVEAAGEGPLQFQWTRNDDAIAGATAAQLDLGSATATLSGDYAVRVTNAAGTTTSRLARLVVAAPQPGRITNLSVRGRAADGTAPLIVGFVMTGGAKSLLVRAIGPALADFGVAGVLADPKLNVYSGSSVVRQNDNWSATGTGTLAMVFDAVGAFPLALDSLDACVLETLANDHTAHVTGPAGTSGITLVEVYDAGAGNSPRLVNVSARNRVGTGDDILVAGFFVSGNEPRALLIRAIGPGLGTFGVTGFLDDPVLEIHTTIDGSDFVFATNDDWQDEPNAASAAVAVPGAFELQPGSRDAVLLITLPAGAYTAVVRGAGATTGEALVEIYEVP